MLSSIAHKILKNVKPGFIFISVMWLVFAIDAIFSLSLRKYGIYPRTLDGLLGVLSSPFLHGSLSHLWNNTIPALLLITALRSFYRSEALKVFCLGMVLTGMLTWIMGRPSYHIGASGVIYMLAAFLIFKGLIAKHFKLVALSFAILFFYGSLIWYIFPIVKGMSWEGHLAGLLTGLGLSLIIKVKPQASSKFNWETSSYDESTDPFMQQFDSEGNFIEVSEEE